MSKKKKKFDRREIQKRLSEIEKESYKSKDLHPKKTIKHFLKKDKETISLSRFIYRDLKRIGYVVMVIIVIFLGLMILNLKTSCLDLLGEKIFWLLNIS